MPLDPNAMLREIPDVDPLQAMAKVQSLRNLTLQGQGAQLENQSRTLGIQQQQTQLADQKATTDAMHEWDGQDYNALPGLILKHGGSATAVIGMKNHVIEQQKTLAGLNEAQLKNQATKNDGVSQIIANVKALPPEQQPDAFEQGKAFAIHNGWLTPQEAQQYTYPGPQGLDLLEKSLIGHKNAVDAAVQQSVLNKNTAEIPGIEAKSDQQVIAGHASRLAQAFQNGGQQAYQSELLNLPMKYARMFPAQGNHDTILQAGMTPDQQATAKVPTEASLAYKSAQGDATSEAALQRLDKSKREARPVTNLNLMPGQGGAALNAGEEATVQAVLEGRMTPPSSFALKTPYWQGIMGEVFKRDPQYSEQRAQLRKGYTVGPQSKEINAINTAMGHVGVMGDAIAALNNGDLKALNGIANRLGVETGNDATTTFNTIVHRVGPELSKAYIGSGGSAGERGADEKDFDPSLGPKQLASNVSMTARLLRSKIGSLENQWEQNRSAGMPSFGQRFITPEAQRQLDRWSPQGNGNAGAGGVSVTDPRGVVHSFPNQAAADAFKKAAGIQ